MTAIQYLIQEIAFNTSDFYVKDFVEEIGEAYRLEREQIINAYVAGYNAPVVDDRTSEYFAAADYFKKQYT